ncbi:MAG TPA: BMP family ABC transporter substrate-binding protein [Candidatus Eubacterium faecipullorum]|uniref:BMP family ABC transporter substrate-binding protein n=1 Tax=Candidatus Eubacterium faecipullorum TaxID=2838571 RepID=A0A9D1UH57_9FIRM|nr:BMP family ABC transporter substrate-binding protein [Candidatus Eubacterium faecipullorum]
MKLAKKIMAIVLSALLVAACFAGCSAAPEGEGDNSAMKVGFIFLHDENSTYDKNFITAAEEACEAMGVEMLSRTNINEDDACYTAAAELVDEGCDIIFADSFGHEDYMIQAATDFPDVQFLHATGTKAHTENLSNFHNAFASIYEGRYLAGVAAGMKLNEMIAAGEITEDQAKMGYVGAYTYAEVISGYTSFYLGAKSVCPSVTMEVTFTGSWYDETAEKEGAEKLINDGCVLISQHADSMGAPTACENAGVPNVSYNGSTISACPNTFIVSSRIDWAPYLEYAIQCVMDGTEIGYDWTGTLDTGSVVLTDVNTAAAAEGTQEKIDEVKAELEAGTLHVFDTSTFTVTVTEDKNVNATVDENGHLTSYMADVDTDAAYTPDTEAVADGYFHESEYRSAPYFDIQIDGIDLLDTAF